MIFRLDNFPILRLLGWIAACLSALPAMAGAWEFRRVSVLAGGAPHWRYLDGEQGLSLHLGAAYRLDAHLAELRQEWTFHPIAYMTSVEKSAALSYGWSVPRTPFRIMAGLGLYEDYRLLGFPLAARLEFAHLDLEAFWQAGESAALGFRMSMRADLP